MTADECVKEWERLYHLKSGELLTEFLWEWRTYHTPEKTEMLKEEIWRRLDEWRDYTDIEMDGWEQ